MNVVRPGQDLRRRFVPRSAKLQEFPEARLRLALVRDRGDLDVVHLVPTLLALDAHA